MVLFITFPVQAQEKNSVTPDFAELKHTKSGKIDKIIDSLTILLNDGTIVRLSSVDIPDFHIWDNATHSDAALKILTENIPKGTEVMLYQTRNPQKGRINRMKQEMAHVVVKKSGVWLQGLLLAQGLARAYTLPNQTEMLEYLYAFENAARSEKKGIWQEGSEFTALSPDQTEKRMGEFVLVEGVVENAASVRNTIYLNFGKDWKTDFTVMISPALRKDFSKKNINPLQLAHHTIRVRGWLREYNGPLIELEDSTHLEILQKQGESLKTDTTQE